jgi:ribonuclease P protein component
MLPKKNRLSLKTEFNRLKKEGKIFQGKFFGLLVAKNQGSTPPRFAFIVSNKIHKKANKRNKVKRLLREATRDFLLQVKPGTEGVFLAKKTILEASYPQIKQEIDDLFKKAGLV